MPWGASSVGEQFKTPAQSDEQFIQHCLSLCAAAGASACTGFSDTACGATATRCCKFSAVRTAADTFFLTSETTYVHAPQAPAAPSSLSLEATALTVGVVVNPWDDSYEGVVTNATGGEGAGAAYVGVRVEMEHANLVDWRVILLMIGAFVLGSATGMLTRRLLPY